MLYLELSRHRSARPRADARDNLLRVVGIGVFVALVGVAAILHSFASANIQ